jgi:hypothetical protein
MILYKPQLQTLTRNSVNPIYSSFLSKFTIPIQPQESFILNVTIENGLKISYNDYSVTFIPKFVLNNGNVLNWNDIPSNIEKDLWKIKTDNTHYKYGVNFNKLTNTQKNSIKYVVLERVNSTGLTWDDVRLEGNTIIIKDKVYISHDDILRTYTIPLINRTHIVIGGLNNNWTECLEYDESLECINSTIVFNWKSNPDGTWNISFDPTITIAENVVPLGNLVNVTSEGNFTHLNISTTAPYNKLTLYYPFDGDTENEVDYNWNGSSNSHVVYDFSGNNRDGITQTRAYINSTGCIYGDCVKLNGNTTAGWRSNVKMPNTITFTGNQSITFMIWAYPYGGQAFSTDARLISGGTECVLRVSGTRIEWILNSFLGATDRVWSPTNTAPINTWTHVVGMYDNSTRNLTVWINGVYKNSTITSGTYGTCTVLIVGGALATSGGNFNGSLDEVMIFNDALTAQQILDIYNNQSARFLATGTQDIVNQTYMNISTGNNRVNVTTYAEGLLGSSINLSVGYYDTSETWAYTTPQVVVSGTNQTFTISSTSTNLTLNYTFYVGNSTYHFYSPIIKSNISLDVWNEAGITNCWTKTGNVLYIPKGCIYQLNKGSIYEI